MQRKGNSAASLKRKGFAIHIATENCMASNWLQSRVFKSGVQHKMSWLKMQLAHTVGSFGARHTAGMDSVALSAGGDILSVCDHLS